MKRIKKYFATYTGKLRSFKGLYILNNLLQRKKLEHNKKLYEQYGLKKSIFSSLGRQDLTNIEGEGPWLDNANFSSSDLAKNKIWKSLNRADQEAILHFQEQGYMILKGFFTKEEVEAHNNEIEEIIRSGKLGFNYTGKKLMESYKYSDFIKNKFFTSPKLMKLFSFIFNKQIAPFHTINFIEGSEQKAHSDSIHMSTAPEGFMIAAWCALEKTDAENGPLFYYPGSHKLPYITCLDYDSGNNNWVIGGNSYKKYEDKIEEVIKENKFNKEHFFAEAGDVLVWHANLLHGGEPILKAGRTRKSMVAHYFCKDVICYHEISQRPALIPEVE